MIDIKLWCIVICAVIIKKVTTDLEDSMTNNTLHLGMRSLSERNTLHAIHVEPSRDFHRGHFKNHSGHENELPTFEATTTYNPITSRLESADVFPRIPLRNRPSYSGRRRIVLPPLPSYVRPTEANIGNATSHTDFHHIHHNIDAHFDHANSHPVHNTTTTIKPSSQNTDDVERKDYTVSINCSESLLCKGTTKPQREDESHINTEDFSSIKGSNSGNIKSTCFPETGLAVMMTFFYKILVKNM